VNLRHQRLAKERAELSAGSRVAKASPEQAGIEDIAAHAGKGLDLHASVVANVAGGSFLPDTSENIDKVIDSLQQLKRMLPKDARKALDSWQTGRWPMDLSAAVAKSRAAKKK